MADLIQKASVADFGGQTQRIFNGLLKWLQDNNCPTGASMNALSNLLCMLAITGNLPADEVKRGIDQCYSQNVAKEGSKLVVPSA